MAVEKIKKDNNIEKDVKGLVKVLKLRGLQVRREKLNRGLAYRVRSGHCQINSAETFFLDRRLPSEQQLSIILDYLADTELSFSDEELSLFSSSTRRLLMPKVVFHEASTTA